jgi:hypothetical protein
MYARLMRINHLYNNTAATSFVKLGDDIATPLSGAACAGVIIVIRMRQSSVCLCWLKKYFGRHLVWTGEVCVLAEIFVERDMRLE